ncbi:MAG: radical SAM protein, partial [Pseudomonadota bacterium]|nr:radical SAM protein [Pseudomonadota bacterium]
MTHVTSVSGESRSAATLSLQPAAGRRSFKIVLIKPSHYDADGYVIQWWRSTIPSNSLASVYGLLAECARAKTLGSDVDIDIDAYDECNTIIDVKKTIRAIRAADGGFVALVGVQSNQFPRALDLAREFRAADLPVVMGGFHVSGCISMLPELPPELKEALALGVTLYAGECEGRMADLLRDLDGGCPKPIYNYLKDMPDMTAAAFPVLPRKVVTRVAGHYASFDAGRGCPFQCSFCTIINVQGRKSRYRTADDVEGIVRANAKQDITRFFITDDNYARNKNWEPILDRLIELREKEGFKIRLLLQVDTLCHRIPGFIEKAARAGCTAVFIGLENINPESLMGAKKRQNKIWEYQDMFHAWRKAKVMTFAGYILGFPTDTPESIARDIEIIKKELPVDILEFFYLTPLPGSEDHKILHLRGVAMDPDMNKYDLEHACTGHPLMSKETWEQVYRDAWTRYYTDEHVETIMRRAATTGLNKTKVIDAVTLFSGSARIEGVHPLQFGFVRRKIRTQRRYGMPIVNPLVFYPWRVVDFCKVAFQWIRLARRYRAMMKRVMADPALRSYSDHALQPPAGHNAPMSDFVRAYA